MSPCARVLLFMASSVSASSLCLAFALAAEPAKQIALMDELCGSCSIKIIATFRKVPGIAKVACDIPNRTVTITSAEKSHVTPRLVWQALDSIGKAPARMTGPEGTFTVQPEE